jgi:hypothetical protein
MQTLSLLRLSSLPRAGGLGCLCYHSAQKMLGTQPSKRMCSLPICLRYYSRSGTVKEWSGSLNRYEREEYFINSGILLGQFCLPLIYLLSAGLVDLFDVNGWKTTRNITEDYFIQR